MDHMHTLPLISFRKDAFLTSVDKVAKGHERSPLRTER